MGDEYPGEVTDARDSAQLDPSMGGGDGSWVTKIRMRSLMPETMPA
jgi:hypothetical protein